jgi:hypothetical protein
MKSVALQVAVTAVPAAFAVTEAPVQDAGGSGVAPARPSLKVTDPVGTAFPVLVKLTVAVNVTCWFTAEAGNCVTLIDVSPEPTDWTSAVAPDALPEKFVSPLL